MNLHPEQPQTCDCQTFFWARKNHSERKFLPITALSALNNTSQTHLYIRLSKWIVLLFLSVHWAQHRRLLADCWWFGLLCLDAPFTFSWYILIQSFFSHTDAVADVWEVYFSKKVDLRLKLPSNILYCCGWNAPSSVSYLFVWSVIILLVTLCSCLSMDHLKGLDIFEHFLQEEFTLCFWNLTISSATCANLATSLDAAHR